MLPDIWEKIFLAAGIHLEMHLHTGVGRYMCGEETALLNALEGKRATPGQTTFSAGEWFVWKTNHR